MNLSAVIFRTMPALERLVRRRTPGPAPIRLSRADIFILPTRSGIWFGLLILALILISINYNNNLTYFLAFLLGSVAFISTWATYRELAGLILAGASAAPVHAGSTARAGIILRNDSRP